MTTSSMSWRTATPSPLPGSRPRRRTSSRTSLLHDLVGGLLGGRHGPGPAVAVACPATRDRRREPASLNGVGGEQDRGQPGQGELGRGSGTRLAERLPGEQRGVERLPVVGHHSGRLDADVAAEGRSHLLGRAVAAEHAGPELVDHHPDPARRDAEVAQLLVAADEGVQADRVGPGHGHHQVGVLHGQPGHRVAAQPDLVVEELLVLLETEPGVDHRHREGDPEQLQQRLPGAWADLGPQLGPGQPGQDPGTAGSGPPDRLPQAQGVQLAPPGHPCRPGQTGSVVQEPERLGHHL